MAMRDLSDIYAHALGPAAISFDQKCQSGIYPSLAWLVKCILYSY